MENEYAIAIIGGGPGGYAAAIRAAQLGLKTICIDKRATLGGTCLNVGCIPSKTLLQTTEQLFHLQRQGKESGLLYSDAHIDFNQLMNKKNEVVKGLTGGIASLFHHHHVEFLYGHAEFISSHEIQVTNEMGDIIKIRAACVLIATGSEPIELKALAFNEENIVSSTGALSLKEIPKHFVVVGGGVIGVELASVYRRLGAQVTVIEMLDHVCPVLDKTLSDHLFKELQKQAIAFKLSTKVLSAKVQQEEVLVEVESQGISEEISANVVLVAVGRRPYTKGLQLEKAGVQVSQRGYIPVDKNFTTAQPHIFAVGDVIEGAMLAHRASAEGVAVVEAMAGLSPIVDALTIPNVIYTYPEVASVGLSQLEAELAGFSIIIGKSTFKNNARARCSGETEGFVKIIGEKSSGRLLGMHIFGAHASELISEGVLAMQKKALVKEIAEAPQAHPTLSEAIKEAALDALGYPIHHIIVD